MNDNEVYTEDVGNHTRIHYRLRQTLYEGRSEFQQIDVVELVNLGRTLFLDHVIQAAENDEFIYHESLVHPAMLLHPHPKRVLVAGGGDGGALREIFRHPDLERVVLAELDPKVVEVSKEYLPKFSAGRFDDPRLEVVYGDAREAIQSFKNAFDVILLDLTEPQEEGPSRLLFTREFFQIAKQALTEHGVLVAQAADVSPSKGKFLADLNATLGEIAPYVRPLLCPIPSFQGIWGLAMASWHADPANVARSAWEARLNGIDGPLKFLSPTQLALGFAPPPYIKQLITTGKVRTDADPFVWTG